MPDYTDLPDTAVGVGGVPSGTTVTALRDNPLAIAEGAAGAPRIQTAGIEDSAVTNVKIADSTIGAEKFQTGITEREWVGARSANIPSGAQGTYILAQNVSGATLDFDATVSGSNLIYASTVAGRSPIAARPSGTWRCMGYALDDEITLFRRD